MDPQRLVLVRTGDPAGSGSGYLVGPRLVLTALHVVFQDGRWTRQVVTRVGHPRYGAGPVRRAAQVCWPDPRDGIPSEDALDVALLWLDEPVDTGEEPVRWGQPSGVVPVPFEGAGFPAFASENDGAEAQSEYLRGDLPVVSTSSPGWVLDCPVWPARSSAGHRPWAGASGSAVFCHGRLVGVAVEDDRAMDWRRLHAVPIHEALSLPGFATLVSRHGHPGTNAVLHEVTAGHHPIGDETPAPSAPAMVGIPPASRTFTGREEPLQTLLATLDPDNHKAPSVSVITGQGGVGKTELALQAAHRGLKTPGWFNGGVLFADLAGYAVPEERRIPLTRVLASFLNALGVDPVPDTVADRFQRYSSELSRWADTGRRVLIVIDNASRSEDVRPLLPADPRVPVLVTSRHTLSDLPNAALIELPMLQPEQSVRLLGQNLRRLREGDRRVEEETAAAHAVADHCGHLPLALHVVSALLADNPQRPIADLAGDLAASARQRPSGKGEGRLLDLLRWGEADVRTALDLSYANLSAEQAQLLGLLAYALRLGRAVSTETLSHLADLAVSRVKQLVEALVRAHLVEPGTQYGQWGLHDLVRAYVDERNARRPDAADVARFVRTRLSSHYADRAREAVSHLDPGAEPSPGFPDRAAALAWLGREADTVTAVVTDALNTKSAQRRFGIDLALDLAPYLLDGSSHQQVVRRDSATAVYEAARKAARSEGERSLELAALEHLGEVLTRAESFNRAISVRTAATRLAKSCPDPLERLRHQANLGRTLLAARRFGHATTVFEQALAMARSLPDPGPERALLPEAAVAWEARGDPGTAARVLKRAQALAHAADDPLREAEAWTGLGRLLRESGMPRGAGGAYLKAAQLLRRTGDRLGEADRLLDVVRLLAGDERHDEALGVCAHIRQLLRENGGSPAREAELHQTVGDLLQAQGRYKEAAVAYQRAMCHAEGGDMPDRWFRHKAVAGLYAAVHAHQQTTSERLLPDEALTALREITDAFAAANRRNDEVMRGLVNMPFSRASLARGGYGTYARQRYYEHNLELQRKMLKANRHIKDRHAEARVLADMGRSLWRAGRWRRALHAWKRAQTMLRRSGDLRGEYELLLCLGQAQQQLGRRDKAVIVYRRLVQVAHQLMRPLDEAVAWQLYGAALIASGERERGVDGYETALQLLDKMGVQQQADEARKQLTELLRRMYDAEQEIASLSRSLRAAQDTGDRVEEAHLLSRLGHHLHTAGRYDEAASARVLAAGLVRRTGDKGALRVQVGGLRRARDELIRTRWRSRVPYLRGRASREHGLFGRYPVKSPRYTLYRRWPPLLAVVIVWASATADSPLWLTLLLSAALGQWWPWNRYYDRILCAEAYEAATAVEAGAEPRNEPGHQSGPTGSQS